VKPQPRPARMTSREFIEWAMARSGGPRHELVAGEVVAMSPERASHNRVKLNIAVALRRAIEAAGLPCQAFTDGMAVEIDDETTYEPDAMVRCGESLSDDAVVVLDPLIVVEVVSPSSGGVDSGAKLADYFRLPSVRHYLIVRARQRTVTHHRRDEAGRIATTIVGAGTLELAPPGIAVEVAEFFA
jgi:Uma2 family endonuclease